MGWYLYNFLTILDVVIFCYAKLATGIWIVYRKCLELVCTRNLVIPEFMVYHQVLCQKTSPQTWAGFIAFEFIEISHYLTDYWL